MKLAYSPASPYVRKVNACAIARGIDKQIERWKVGTTDPALLEFNPNDTTPLLQLNRLESNEEMLAFFEQHLDDRPTRVDFWNTPISSRSSAGLRFSKSWPDSEATHEPSMKFW